MVVRQGTHYQSHRQLSYHLLVIHQIHLFLQRLQIYLQWVIHLETRFQIQLQLCSLQWAAHRMHSPLQQQHHLQLVVRQGTHYQSHLPTSSHLLVIHQSHLHSQQRHPLPLANHLGTHCQSQRQPSFPQLACHRNLWGLTPPQLRHLQPLHQASRQGTHCRSPHSCFLLQVDRLPFFPVCLLLTQKNQIVQEFALFCCRFQEFYNVIL